MKKAKKTVREIIKEGTGITVRTVTNLPPDDYFKIIGDKDTRIEARYGRTSRFYEYDFIDFLEAAEQILEVAASKGNTGEWLPDSPEDFARRTIDVIEEADYEYNEGNFDKAVRAAFKLGIIVEAARIKGIWEKPALIGKKRIEDQARFAKIGIEEKQRKVAATHETWLTKGRALRLKHKDWKTRNIAIEVHKKTGLPEKSFQNLYKVFLKNNV